jgi:hypothetical protein
MVHDINYQSAMNERKQNFWWKKAIYAVAVKQIISGKPIFDEIYPFLIKKIISRLIQFVLLKFPKKQTLGKT